jgi:hypothetical protein
LAAAGALPEGHHATAWDIKRWRYRLFATAGKIITRARKSYLLLPGTVPEHQLIHRLLEATARIAASLTNSNALMQA